MIREGEETQVNNDEAGLGVGGGGEREEGDVPFQVCMGGNAVNGVVEEEGGVESGEDTRFKF